MQQMVISVMVVVAYVLMVASNVLSMKGKFGDDNAVISNENPTFVTPDGKTFAIWGLIYLMQTIMVVVQLMPTEHMEELLDQTFASFQIRTLIVFIFCMNAVWLPAFASRRFILSLGIMSLYLAGLMALLFRVNMTSATTALERVVLVAPFSLNISWIVVACAVNNFVCLRQLGWKDQNGVGGAVWAGHAVIVIVTVLACFQAVVQCDLAYAFIACWALMGIYRMQTVPDKVRYPIFSMNSGLAKCAQINCGVIALASVVGVVLAVQRKL